MPGTLTNLLPEASLSRFDGAEVPQQRLAPDFAHPGCHPAHCGHGLGASLTMEHDRETVGFIPHSLQEVQALTRARKDHRELTSGDQTSSRRLASPTRATSSIPSSANAARAALT